MASFCQLEFISAFLTSKVSQRKRKADLQGPKGHNIWQLTKILEPFHSSTLYSQLSWLQLTQNAYFNHGLAELLLKFCGLGLLLPHALSSKL